MLSMLVIRPNEWVPEERLANFGWGPRGATRAALHCAVSRLRRCLARYSDRNWIEHSDAGYRISVPPERVDTAVFRQTVEDAAKAGGGVVRLQRLGTALRVWRGRPLTHTSDWVRCDPEVLALERDRLQCGYDLADLGLSCGRAQTALPLIERLAVELPYDEPLQARRLLLMNAVGRRAEALRLYDRIRRQLADELGVDPSGTLRTTHLALLGDGSDEMVGESARVLQTYRREQVRRRRQRRSVVKHALSRPLPR
ncbi:hypothetical protein GCM10027290_19400 [Micromonospora sonneratiae]|uniref:BTAD domain-containing putative transcriptional regulator n=1 Tax=Micromonospora sonneratiae TaxID=1184706 RepID=A0ABW3YK50_9ACTN